MEVVPVVSVDRLIIGNGKKGETTEAIQKIYFDIARGINPVHAEWRTPIYGREGNGKEEQPGNRAMQSAL